MEGTDQDELVGKQRGNPYRELLKRFQFFAQMGALALALLLWTQSDRLWPQWLLPRGLPISSERQVNGLLTLGEQGRPAEFIPAEDLLADWRHWVQQDERRDSAKCLTLPEDIRHRLSSQSPPRPGAAGRVQYWVSISIQDRLGQHICDGSAMDVRIAPYAPDVLTERPVPCSRDTFVAHGFVCPFERRSDQRVSETILDFYDYYPVEALELGTEGTVKVIVTRDPSGSPIECQVSQSSRNDLLDRQTCKLVGTDPAFTRRGNTSPDTPITQSVIWRLPKVGPDREP